VNLSPFTTGLVPSRVVTVTSTKPGEPGGVTTFSEVLESTVTFGAGVEPNCTVAPLVKPVPLIETVVPPVTSPKALLTLVTVGPT
jgi:hypothetical protein